jgi:hypothetical protein
MPAASRRLFLDAQLKARIPMSIHLKPCAMAMVLAVLTPIVAQAKPDLTGVWMAPFRVHSSGVPMGSGVSPWMPVSAGDPRNVKLPTLDEMSARIDGIVKANNGNPEGAPPAGLRPGPAYYTPAGVVAANAIDRKQREERELACYPNNVLSRIGGGPIQIVQNERAVAILSEGGSPGRVVFLDGRGNGDAIPMWNGHSIGHWQGDILKVETVAIRGGMFGQAQPMSDDAKVTEEYNLSPDGQKLTIFVIFEDPAYYKEPLRKVAYLNRRNDVEVTDFTCQEGKEDMIETALEKEKVPAAGKPGPRTP